VVSDESLYERLLLGDLAAFDALYERYERPLFAFVYKQLSDAREAEDVIHDAFLGLLKDGQVRRSLHSFRAWLYQSARNLCLNRVRSSRREARALEVEARGEPVAAAHPEAELQQRQLVQSVRVAVEKLPAPLSELYHLRASGLSYDELAHVLQVPIGTVKSRMHEMVNRLREGVAT